MKIVKSIEKKSRCDNVGNSFLYDNSSKFGTAVEWDKVEKSLKTKICKDRKFFLSICSLLTSIN